MAHSGSKSGECAICSKAVRDARLLECLHSFCKSCLDDLGMRGSHEISCPVCRSKGRLPDSGASALPRDITHHFEPANECHTCQEEGGQGTAKVVCSACSVAFCEDHGTQHILDNPAHSVAAAAQAGSSSSKPGASNVTKLCESHSTPLKYFCKRCGTAVCGDCVIVGAHQKHEPIVTVPEITKELQERVCGKVDNLKTEVLPRAQKIQSVVEDFSSELASHAEKVGADFGFLGKLITDAIQKAIQEKIDKTLSADKVRLTGLKSQYKELQQHVDCLSSAVRFGEAVFQLGGDAESDKWQLYDVLSAIDKRADQLADVKISVPESVQDAQEAYEEVSENELVQKAKELVESVDERRRQRKASAPHCSIKGETKVMCVEGLAVSFVVIAKDKNNQSLSKGGDTVRAEWRKTPEGVSPHQSPIEVRDNKNGSYQISCTPTKPGDYLLEAFVNGGKMQQHLSINCQGRPQAQKQRLTFDPNECQKDNTVSEDCLTVTHTGRNQESSVLGSVGMQSGQHMWKVKVIKSQKMSILIGVAEKPKLTATPGNYTLTYSWSGSDGKKFIMGKGSKGFGKWKQGDILQLEVDCRNHTLSITNTRSGEKDSITNLPDCELFPYFRTFHKSDVLALA